LPSEKISFAIQHGKKIYCPFFNSIVIDFLFPLKVKEKDVNLQCFTFQWKDGSVVDARKELGFLNHKIKVLPAADNDHWTEWRVDARGIVELEQPAEEDS
jgi:hypothetical protein